MDKALSIEVLFEFPMSELPPPGRPDPLLAHTNLSIALIVAFVVIVIALVARVLYS